MDMSAARYVGTKVETEVVINAVSLGIGTCSMQRCP